jgi:hypothetical protein
MCEKLTGYDGKKLLSKITIPTFIMEGEKILYFLLILQYIGRSN